MPLPTSIEDDTNLFSKVCAIDEAFFWSFCEFNGGEFGSTSSGIGSSARHDEECEGNNLGDGEAKGWRIQLLRACLDVQPQAISSVIEKRKDEGRNEGLSWTLGRGVSGDVSLLWSLLEAEERTMRICGLL